MKRASDTEDHREDPPKKPLTIPDEKILSESKMNEFMSISFEDYEVVHEPNQDPVKDKTKRWKIKKKGKNGSELFAWSEVGKVLYSTLVGAGSAFNEVDMNNPQRFRKRLTLLLSLDPTDPVVMKNPSFVKKAEDFRLKLLSFVRWVCSQILENDEGERKKWVGQILAANKSFNYDVTAKTVDGKPIPLPSDLKEVVLDLFASQWNTWHQKENLEDPKKPIEADDPEGSKLRVTWNAFASVAGRPQKQGEEPPPPPPPPAGGEEPVGAAKTAKSPEEMQAEIDRLLKKGGVTLKEFNYTWPNGNPVCDKNGTPRGKLHLQKTIDQNDYVALQFFFKLTKTKDGVYYFSVRGTKNLMLVEKGTPDAGASYQKEAAFEEIAF